MIYQFEMFDALQPILTFLIIIVLMAVMLIVFLKIENWMVCLVILLFSLIIGILSISMGDIPFTPYFQIFFIVFQSVIFLITSLDAFTK
ncbi:MAG: hypothetical protein WBH31_11710 [Promethearchaeia archaeon]